MSIQTKSARFASVSALVAGLATFAGPVVAQAPSVGNPARGKELYYANACYGCHGFSGQTGARNLVGTNSPIIASPQTFILFLRQRGSFQPMIPSTSMPMFSERALSNQQALDIYAYVKTFVLDAPDVKDVPVLATIQASAATPYKPAK